MPGPECNHDFSETPSARDPNTTDRNPFRSGVAADDGATRWAWHPEATPSQAARAGVS
jgi:hypothetical protein